MTQETLRGTDEYHGSFDTEIITSPIQHTDLTSEEKQKETKKFKTDSASNSIRVDLSKIDELMNNIGELVIAHSMLSQYIYTMEDQKIKSDLSERLDLIDRHIRELQESIMSVRMVPMETVFSKFPKVIRDTAKKIDKKIEFRSFGEGVEIDKVMIEGLTDPLMHIVRNGLDHGIESPEIRRKAGKPEVGVLTMSAEQANGQIILKIQDDGRGINLSKVTAKALENGIINDHQMLSMDNNDKAMLIFAPGLSTADAITDISGRGVGMDVVMSNIKKLGGAVKVDTEEGCGSIFTITLPLTLAILDGLNIRVGQKQFILPLSTIIESIKPEEEMIKQIGDDSSEVLMLRNEFIPVVRLHTIFNIEHEHQKLSDGLLIIVRSAGEKIALFIDEFMNQQQFVIKPLDRNFRNARGIGGATVRGDGTIGLIVDTMNIMEKN
jgi:two-component system chemotaxis sensor kinase CheA